MISTIYMMTAIPVHCNNRTNILLLFWLIVSWNQSKVNIPLQFVRFNSVYWFSPIFFKFKTFFGSTDYSIFNPLKFQTMSCILVLCNIWVVLLCFEIRQLNTLITTTVLLFCRVVSKCIHSSHEPHQECSNASSHQW